LASSFDCTGQLTLVFGAGTRYATWQDFATLADEFTQQVRIFVIDVLDFVHSEIADFATLISATTSHGKFPPSLFSKLSER
jgi:hypothetical protein